MVSAAPGGGTSVAVLHLGRNGGGPKFTYELANALAGSGARVSCIVSRDADNRGRFEEVGPVLELTTFRSALGALVRSPLLVGHAVRTLRFVRRQGIEVVLVAMEQIWQPPILWALRLAGIRVIVCVHDAELHPGDGNPAEGFLRDLQRRAASGFIVFSSHVGTELQRRWPGRPLATTVHGVFGTRRAESVRRAPESRVPVVGFFGRMARYKGLGLGYDAIERLRAEGQAVEFRVVGDGTDPALARMTHPDDRLRVGWTPDAAVPEVLDGFDVLLLPYIEASQSGVLAYALSAALPTVVTPVGGLVEQAVGTGAAVVAEAVEPEALALALKRVLEDGHLYATLSRAAADAASDEYSWRRVADDVLDAIARPHDVRHSEKTSAVPCA